MTLGAILVIIGVILAVVDIFIGGRRYGTTASGSLLNLAVILIGIGVLVGGAQIDT